MKKITIILCILIFCSKVSISQTVGEIDFLIKNIKCSSEAIIGDTNAKKIISYGKRILPKLSSLFRDSVETSIYSKCLNRVLTTGEIAIIIADQIKGMPFFTLTGLQNCMLDFCKDNPNLIEYYLPHISRDKGKSFQEKYVHWLRSKEFRKKN